MIDVSQILQKARSQLLTASKQSPPLRAVLWANLLLVGMALPSVAVHAQTERAAPASHAKSGGFLGLGVHASPRYQGADEAKGSAMPMFSYQWSNGLFVGGSDGLVGFQNQPTDQLRLSVALGMDQGRYASDSRYLAGMGDVVASATVNLHAKFDINDKLEVSTAIRIGSGSASKGGVVELGASYGVMLSPATRMRLHVKTTWANDDYMQDYFGVNSVQSTATGYKSYTPSAGLRDITLGLGAQHNLNRQWMLIGGLNHTTLSNAAIDSPLTRNSTSQSLFAAIAYRF